jgi:acetyl esterase
MSMPWQTRLFAAVLGRLSAPQEEVDDARMAQTRARRSRQLTMRGASIVFGRPARDVAVREVEVPLADGFVSRVLLHVPTGADVPGAGVLNFHGGGWCQGEPRQSAWLASHVASRTGAVVVSPSYRLAPEHRYPAASDDAVALLEWLLAHGAEVGVDLARVAVMGDSAGGNLAAVCALHARDHGVELRGQVLVYPAVEIYERYPSEDANAHAPVLTSRSMRTFSRTYLGEAYGVEDWQASPIRAASHEGLCPALVLTAGHDPLRDHGEKYRAVLEAAGVKVQLVDYPEAIHGFMSLPGVVPAAKDALDEVVAFLRVVL